MRHHPRVTPGIPGTTADQAVLLVFATTLLVSATLLFFVEPMFAKRVLPLLGGTPAVWNTCLVFYQTSLLLGYLYAHAATRWLGPRRRAGMHLAVLLLPWLVLPIGQIGAGWTPPADADPIFWLLGLLTVAVGLPFFVVSSSAPMLQAWFAETGHPAAKDPYFLYAASNLGSMIGLLGYPVLVEPRLRLAEQSTAWTAGYGLLMLLTAACAVVLWRRWPAPQSGDRFQDEAVAQPDVAPAPTALERLRWVLLALAPSSLLLGVTTHISTDIAAVPLLWVVPLALYLLSFVLVFARRPLLSHRWMLWIQPLPVAMAAALYYHGDVRTFWLEILLHLAAFFVTAMVCHGELARSRPHPLYLTEFYIWISVGGMLGGWFNALVAPVVFPWVLEYPLMIVAACLLRPSMSPVSTRRARWLDVALPLVLTAAFSGLVFRLVDMSNRAASGSTEANVLEVAASAALLAAAAAAIALARRPVRFGLAVAGLIVLSAIGFPSSRKGFGIPQRNFFGVIRIAYVPYCDAFAMTNGTTNHGMQSRKPEMKLEPLTYYYRTGPIGEVFQALGQRRRLERVGVVGLGTGTMACYGESGQRWTFFDINPIVVQLARNQFTYLEGSKAAIDIQLGDARLSLARRPDHQFDLLCLDAFSSDTIPLHLVTREAIALYFRKLAPGGVLAIHVSNNYLDLAPPLANIAAAEGLDCRVRDSDPLSTKEQWEGKFSNTWLVMARRAEDLGKLAENSKWKRRGADPAAPLWTDDFSDILSVTRWKR